MRLRTRRIIELGLSVVLASVAIMIGVGLLSWLIGGSLVTVKVMLFGVGFILFGIGSIGLRPAPAAPHKDKLVSFDEPSQSRFEAWIQTLPPLNNQPIRFEDRVSRSWKLFITSLLILGISMFLEIGLGVTAGSA